VICPTQTHDWKSEGTWPSEYVKLGKQWFCFYVRCSKCGIRGFRKARGSVVYVCEQIGDEK